MHFKVFRSKGMSQLKLTVGRLDKKQERRESRCGKGTMGIVIVSIFLEL